MGLMSLVKYTNMFTKGGRRQNTHTHTAVSSQFISQQRDYFIFCLILYALKDLTNSNVNAQKSLDVIVFVEKCSKILPYFSLFLLVFDKSLRSGVPKIGLVHPGSERH